MRGFGPAEEFFRKQRAAKENEVWKSKMVGNSLTKVELEVLQNICSEHPSTVSLEYVPSDKTGNVINTWKATVFYHKDHPQKLDWVMFLFHESMAKLKELHEAAKKIVIDAIPSTDPSEHPENAYEGPEPLEEWYKKTEEPVQPVAKEATQLPGGVKLPMMANIRLNLNDDWPFGGRIF